MICIACSVVFVISLISHLQLENFDNDDEMKGNNFGCFDRHILLVHNYYELKKKTTFANYTYSTKKNFFLKLSHVLVFKK